MDTLDSQILAFLQEDGRKRFTEIAKELGVTEGTVRNRVAKLQEANVMRITALVDPLRVGYDAPAIVGVSVQSPHLDEAAAELTAFSEVGYLIMVSGEYDLIVEIFCRDREHLASFLRDKLQNVTGVVRTQTFFILHTFKMSQGVRPELDMETEGN
ncbi:MAG: AsnC family transcriptional regulator [Aquificales bacterium]|nr:AsnC family transcriptional regulator [Aquificales bacterium]